MADIPSKSKYEFMPEFIKQAIDREVKLATEEELENAKKRIEERRSQIIAGVLLYIQREIQVETIGEKLIITIRQK